MSKAKTVEQPQNIELAKLHAFPDTKTVFDAWRLLLKNYNTLGADYQEKICAALTVENLSYYANGKTRELEFGIEIIKKRYGIPIKRKNTYTYPINVEILAREFYISRASVYRHEERTLEALSLRFNPFVSKNNP